MNIWALPLLIPKKEKKEKEVYHTNGIPIEKGDSQQVSKTNQQTLYIISIFLNSSKVLFVSKQFFVHLVLR